jgi:hypothetical protein
MDAAEAIFNTISDEPDHEYVSVGLYLYLLTFELPTPCEHQTRSFPCQLELARSLDIDWTCALDSVDSRGTFNGIQLM